MTKEVGIELEIGPDPYKSVIKIDGQDVSSNVGRVKIVADCNDGMTRIELRCYNKSTGRPVTIKGVLKLDEDSGDPAWLNKDS